LGNLRGAPNEINRTQANFGTNVKYAKFHQYGTTKMPKREIVFVPDIMRKKFADYARDYVRDGVEGLAR
jgi:phage gpG-like protein